MVDQTKLVLFAIEALGLVGVLFLLQRIIRTRKRRSDPINVADGKPSVPLVGDRSDNDKTSQEP